METFTLADARRLRSQKDKPYHEFLHVPAMSAGVYELGVGDEDKQQPRCRSTMHEHPQAGSGRIILEPRTLST